MSGYGPPKPNPYSSPAQPVMPSFGEPASPGEGGTSKTLEMLRQTRPWVLFLSIVAFIFGALMILGGLFMLAAGANMGRAMPGLGGEAAAIVGLVYIVMAVLMYIVPGVLLFRYANQINHFLFGRSQHRLDSALEAQKVFWKYFGILTLVFLILLVVYMCVVFSMVMSAGPPRF